MNNLLISQALVELGFNSGWTVTGDTLEGIEWIDEPTKKPTNKELQDVIDKLPDLQAAKVLSDAQKKQAILDRLGITAEEANLILG
jgi:hypothetical protein